MRKLIVLLAFAAFAGILQASELYWCIGKTSDELTGRTLTTSGKSPRGEDMTFEWQTVRLMANNASSPLQSISAEVMYDNYLSVKYVSDSLSSVGSFYLELLNAQNEVIARSESKTYSSLAGSIAEMGSMNQSATPYQFTAFVAPEPTSGLMLLVGLAMLGLKRKKAGV